MEQGCPKKGARGVLGSRGGLSEEAIFGKEGATLEAGGTYLLLLLFVRARDLSLSSLHARYKHSN